MDKLIYHFAAGEAEIQGAFMVRMDVFVREQRVPRDEELDEFDRAAQHLVVKDGNRVIATARLYFPSLNEARIGRMAVLKQYRHKGIGRRMLTILCEEARLRNASIATLHAQWHARPFYSASGFIESGAPFREAGIEHILMAKKL